MADVVSMRATSSHRRLVGRSPRRADFPTAPALPLMRRLPRAFAAVAALHDASAFSGSAIAIAMLPRRYRRAYRYLGAYRTHGAEHRVPQCVDVGGRLACRHTDKLTSISPSITGRLAADDASRRRSPP